MTNLITYLKTILGLNVRLSKKPSENLIHCQNSSFAKDYQFSEISVSGQKVIVAEWLSNEKTKGTKLAKEYHSMKAYFDFFILLHLPAIDNMARRLLIGNKVNFVVPNLQLHFPELCISLREYPMAKRRNAKYLTISAQVLLLYHLQKKSLAGVSFKEIAKLIGYTPKTVSLSVAELINYGIAKVVTKSDKTKSLQFYKRGVDLYNYIDKWLQSPILEAGYTNQQVDTISSVQIGYAVWYHFFESRTDVREYGLTSKQAKEHKIKVYRTYREHTVQVWKYNPMLMAKDGYADILSVLLSRILIVDGIQYRFNYEKDKKIVLDKIIWADSDEI